MGCRGGALYRVGRAVASAQPAAVLRDLCDTLHKQCASGARPGLSVHDFRRTTSGVRLPAYGFRCTASGARLPASFQRLPAHGFRLPLHGSRRTASGAWISASHAQLPAQAGSGTGRPLMIRAHSFLCVTVCKFHPACSQGWMKAMALLI